MPSKPLARRALPSQGREQQTLTLSTWSTKAETSVDLIGRIEGRIHLWEHFSFPPGPEYPLWPAELIMFLNRVQVWWSEFAVSDDLGRVFLRNCRPRFDYLNTQTVLPF